MILNILFLSKTNRMNARLLLIYAMIFLMACGGKDEKNASNTPKTAADVVAFYNEMKLPTEISDTNIIRKMDTSHIEL
jgi:hypothetical protein